MLFDDHHLLRANPQNITLLLGLLTRIGRCPWLGRRDIVAVDDRISVRIERLVVDAAQIRELVPVAGRDLLCFEWCVA